MNLSNFFKNGYENLLWSKCVYSILQFMYTHVHKYIYTYIQSVGAVLKTIAHYLVWKDFYYLGSWSWQFVKRKASSCNTKELLTTYTCPMSV